MAEELRGIFALKCFKGNKARIIHLDNVMLKQNEFIDDTLVKEFSIIENIPNKDTIGQIYSCNITDIFLMSTKKLPVMYLSVIHQKPIQKFLLYKVYLYYTITNQIKSVNDLLEKKVGGKYSMEIVIDNQRKEIDDPIPEYPGIDKMFEKLETFTKEESMKELTISLVDEINQRTIKQYAKELEHLMKKPDNYISLKNYKGPDSESDKK
ncbi:MAG: hypothetical protein Barrevirus8_16 [Barrevirus sp.]|uniref:Uncharacterized protein n=1 Tax=Barrevirus sp. TaxID=2487763 RepID=A0A3G4ZQ54_9VIRU|nr:MAG: hypothetical protein Barrevirus8_16 [Barrevirus sp.]